MKMKNKTTKRIVAGCLLVGILASVGIGAYLTDTDTKSDMYTVGNVQAEIVANGDMEVANAGYLLPGTTHVYERAATNTGINDAYVFMSITIPYETVGVADDDGTQLGEFVRQVFVPGYIGAEWKLVDEGFIGEYEIEANGQYCGEHDTHSVALGNTITYVYGYIGDNADGSLKALASGETTANLVETMKLTNLYNIANVDGEVSTKLYAIQSNHVNGGLTDVNGVWAVINTALVGEVLSDGEEELDKTTYDLVIPDGTTAIEIGAYANEQFKSVYIPASVTVIGDYAFYSCPNLELVTFEKGSNLKTIAGQAFGGCSNLTTIDLPTSVTEITYAFDYSGITEIVIPASVDVVSGFAYCTNLTTVTFEDGSNAKKIGRNAFEGCTNLTSFNIPEGVETIENGAFSGCSSLTSIEIPSSVKTIESAVFGACRSLKEINFGGTEAQWNQINFEHNWNVDASSDYVINFLGEEKVEVNLDEVLPEKYAGSYTVNKSGLGVWSDAPNSMMPGICINDTEYGVRVVFALNTDTDEYEYFGYYSYDEFDPDNQDMWDGGTLPADDIDQENKILFARLPVWYDEWAAG